MIRFAQSSYYSKGIFVYSRVHGVQQQMFSHKMCSFNFRISIILMIFVNYGCGGYEILDHAVWNGLHVADVIFPWFLWIMGVCIPISLSSAFKRGTSKTSALLNVLRVNCGSREIGRSKRAHFDCFSVRAYCF